MESLWNIITILTIFVFLEEPVSSKQIWLSQINAKSPLSLIEKRNGALELATPQKYRTEYVAYTYDDSKDSRGLREELFTACPARNNSAWEFKTQENLRNSKTLTKESKLLIADKYNAFKNICDVDLVPSIEKSVHEDDDGNVKYCGRSNAEIYEVGYPVIKRNGSESDMKFISIYEICYSEVENRLLYTIHRIMSPNLLLQRLWEFYELDLISLLETSLDKRNITNKSLYEEHYAYKFVGSDDMPTRIWERTTSFSINYTLISKDKDLMKGIITADNYIRLFSRETNRPLTLLSGNHQMTVKIQPVDCLETPCESESTPVEFFWRIIKDDNGLVTIIVTQHTLVKCGQAFICNEQRIIIQEYKNGGCTYTCLVNNELIELLGLPKLQFSGALELKFTQKIPKREVDSSQEVQSSKEKIPKDFSITDFMNAGEETFKSVLTEADAELAANVQVQRSVRRD